MAIDVLLFLNAWHLVVQSCPEFHVLFGPWWRRRYTVLSVKCRAGVNMPKVLVYGALDQAAFDILNARTDVVTTPVKPFDTDTLHAELENTDAVILQYLPFDAETVARAKMCKVISRIGVGCDNIDMKAVAAAGIPVATTGNANSRPVAEHVLALMLAITKRLADCDFATRAGDWERRELMGITELDGKEVLVVGFGRIGQRTAELCKTFGMSVSIYDPFISEEAANGAGCKRISSLDTAIPEADYITLHIPGGTTNANLIDRQRIGRMKPNAVIINTSRGQLIDEAALAEALNDGRILGAGIDVFSDEPPAPDNPLLTSKRCILTPHAAGLTRECVRRMSVVSARNALAGIDGTLDPTTVVNRSAINLETALTR